MTPEVFWGKVDKAGVGGCWLWQGAITNYGYGQVNVKGKHIGAHRMAYEWSRGAVPQGLELDHLCRTRACVRPGHLEAVTHRENCLRGTAGDQERVKTHCPKGHAYDMVNTRYEAQGRKRRCRQCKRERERRWPVQEPEQGRLV